MAEEKERGGRKRAKERVELGSARESLCFMGSVAQWALLGPLIYYRDPHHQWLAWVRVVGLWRRLVDQATPVSDCNFDLVRLGLGAAESTRLR